MLDIISPLYNSSRLYELLKSIDFCKYKNNVNVILVNDGDNYDYSPVLNQFQHLNITYLKYDKNQGPGIARQYGVNHSNASFLTFIDSDDIFLPNGIDTIIEIIQQYPNNYLYLFDFIENNIKCSKIDHYGTMGQVYQRDFLKKYNINFPTEQPYYLEDYGFNLACMFILKYYYPNDKIYHIAQPLSQNIGLSNSLTRKNYNEFIYKNWALGCAWNTKYAIDIALKNGVDRHFLLFDASKIMSEQYWFYCSTRKSFPQYLDAVLEGCKYYYNNCYKQFQNEFGDELTLKIWKENYSLKINSISFVIDFSHFLNNLKNNTI